MKKYLFLLIFFVYAILIFSTNFLKSNEGYYEVPSYRTFGYFEFNNNFFDKNIPFLLANLEYKNKTYFLPYKKYLYKNNEIFVLGLIDRNTNYLEKNFHIYSIKEALNKFSKEINNANISILILYENVSLHGVKISQESTDINTITDKFTLVIKDTYPREIYSLDNSIFEKYYKEENKDDNYIYYKVKNGDTLYSISRIFGVSIEYLTNINNIKSPDFLKEGIFIIVGTSDDFKVKGEENDL
ncbi:hypothetical protein JCM30566_12280 [Marinitoga arctica]